MVRHAVPVNCGMASACMGPIAAKFGKVRHGRRRAKTHRADQARHPQHRTDPQRRPGTADPRRRYRRRDRRANHGDRPRQRPRHGRRDHDRRRQGLSSDPRPHRQPRASRRRRLDAASKPAELDRLVHAWRGDDDDLRRRGAYARPPARHCRPEGDGDHGATHLCGVPAGRGEASCRRPGDRARHGRKRLRRARLGRRETARRDRPRRRQGRADRAQDGRLGAQARHPEHDSHGRAVDPRLRPHRQGHRARMRRRCRRPHQWRPHRLAGRSDSLHLRGLQARARTRA